MSEAALRERAWRQERAAPGGRVDRVVGIARVALPSAAGALIGLLAAVPLTQNGDVSFLLDKNKVDVASERLRVEAAEYRGQDGDGRPFSLTAASAVQRTSAETVVRMNDLAARIQLSDGPASLTADRGRYDLAQNRVAIDGPVLFGAADGYRLRTRDVVLDLKSRSLVSGGAVAGRMPLGTFTAQRMRVGLDERHVVLDGGASLKIVQGALN